MLSNLRVAGLASGMDTESIIKDLMRAHRMPVDRLQQNRQILEWQQEDYREINIALRSFRDQVFNMRLQSSFLVKKVTSSNESVVTVSANANSLDGQHTIQVSQLARGASVTGGTLESSPDLTTLNSQFDTPHGLIDLEINNVVFKFDAASESISSVVNRISKHNAAGVSLNTTQKATEDQAQVQVIRLVDDALVEGMTITTGDKKIALWDSTAGTYAGEAAAKAALGADYIFDISNPAYDTADEIVAAIAEETAPTGASWTKSGAGELTLTSNESGASNTVSATVSGGKEWHVQASYDVTLDRFFLSTNVTGANQHLRVADNTLAQLLKLTNGNGTLDTSDLNVFPDDNDGPKTVNGAIAADGRNASVTVDGMKIDEYTGNQFTLNGVTYTLHNTSESNITVNVQQDTDAMFELVKGFVDQYNSIVVTITDKLYEKKYPDYQPLTDEQREQLSDDQIEKWEEKARSGMLRNDTLLSGLAARLRQTMSSVVPGLDSACNALADMGITTTADYMSAKLEINDTALRGALQNDSAAVMDLFTKGSDNYSEKGIAQRLYDDITFGMNQIIDQAGSYNEFSQVDNSFIGKRLEDIDLRINNWENRLAGIEDRYWRQFTAMEKAIQQMNSQSMWLMQQFGMGQQ